jgi:catechol 2,3-dioxygenase-like lactoylglutathione lyase family enzyme
MTAAQASPTVCVEDIDRTARFYGVTLGFDVMYPRGKRGGLIVFVRGGGRLHFRAAAPRQVETIAVRLDATYACSLASNLASHGIAIFDRNAAEDGVLEAFSVCDPDGHRITLTTRARLRVIETAEEPQRRQPRRWLFDWRTNSASLVLVLQVVGFTPAV